MDGPVIRLLLLVSFTAQGQQIYDLLLKNGHVIDSANHRNQRLDVGIAAGKIVRVASGLEAAHARVVIDASDYYVTPGLIDICTHFDAEAAGPNLQPDHQALPNGVTTAVDAGGADWKTFEAFKTKVVDRSKTRMFAFLNIGADGDREATARMALKYPQIIVGITTSAETLDSTIHAAALSKTMIMAGAGAADSTVLRRLRPGDIVTNIYSRAVRPDFAEARKGGMLFDVGREFWFRFASSAIRQGFLPDTISSGIDRDGVLLPRANLSVTMSKFLNLGLTLEQIIERTTVNPARAIRRPELGTLGEGSVADISLFEVQKGKFGYLDSGHARLTGDQRIRCVLTVRNGSVVWDSEGLNAPDWMKAGPYTNFK
jgi:dihydroorotase